jgi:hypothetical protein
MSTTTPEDSSHLISQACVTQICVKSSLIWRAAQELVGSGDVLVAQVDLTVQRALEALIDDELVSRFADCYRIAEPFLAEWIISGDFQGVTADHPPRPSSCRGATGR